MNGPDQHIVVVDLRIPFMRLVFFLVKLTLAAIPASIILMVIAAVIAALVSWLLGGPYAFRGGPWRL